MKFKPPTWKDTNSVKNLVAHGLTPAVARKRVVANNKIAIKLRRHGWKFRESVNIFETGFTLAFSKELDRLDTTYIHPYIHFEWHWDNQGSEDFWIGTMYSFYNYKPKQSPYGLFEIRNISQDSIKHLNSMAYGVTQAVCSQHPIYGD
jgi:hypothetical protein